MPLVIRLTPEIESGLRALSREEGVSQAEVVRQLIKVRLSTRVRRASAYEIAEAMGVIGIDAGKRTDVAQRHSAHLKRAMRGKRAP
jgi:hypothetical protein